MNVVEDPILISIWFGFLQEDVINTQCGYDVRQQMVGISSISVDLFRQGNQGNL